MNRTKAALINSMSFALYSVITIAVGIIIPRLIIGKYGDSVNGLTVSIQQYISYLAYLELGISSIFIFNLYKPLANKDEQEINLLVNSAKKVYNKTSLYYLIGILVVAIIYPFITNIEGVDIFTAIALIVVIGLHGLLEMYSVSKYRVLLTADQKVYVINFASIVATLLNFGLTFLLIKLNQNIIFVKFIALLPIIFRTIFLHFYTKKQYPFIMFAKHTANENYVKEKNPKVKRFDAMIMEISRTVGYSLPVLALSTFQSLEVVSIFSVYYLVIKGLGTIISNLTSGTTAAFGQTFLQDGKQKTKSVYSQFELLFVNAETILYSTAIALMIPFIHIYIKDVSNITNYVNLSYGALFVVWAFIDDFKVIPQTIIKATGKFKEAKLPSILFMVVEVLFLLILVPKWGINGALIAMIIASTMKSIWFLIIVKKHVFEGVIRKSIIRFIIGFSIMCLSLYFFNFVVKLNVINFGYFILYGFALVLFFALISFGISLIIDFKDTTSVFNRFFKRKKQK